MDGRSASSGVGTFRHPSGRRNTFSVYSTPRAQSSTCIFPVFNRRRRPSPVAEQALQPVERLERLTRRQLVEPDLAQRGLDGGGLGDRGGRAERQAEERQILGEAGQRPGL